MSEQINHFPTNLNPSLPSRAPRVRLGLEGWKTLYPGSLTALADEMARRVSQPIDELEVAALLESSGINDDVAASRYGVRDVFELAGILLEQWKAGGLPAPATKRGPEAHPGLRHTLVDYARGPMALATVFVVLLIIAFVNQSGRWGERQVLAMSLGMTGSMLATNGFVQAISRRGAIYLSRGNTRAAGQYLWTSMALAGGLILGAAVLVVFVMARLGLFTVEERLIFVFAFVGLSAIWLMAAILALVQVPGWLALGLTASLIVGLIVDRVVNLFSGMHLGAAAAVGFVVAMGLMLRAARRVLEAGANRQSVRAPLPSASYLVYEAAPYFAYGTFYLVLILLPHALGWAGALGVGQARMWAAAHLEAGLTLAMVPLLLAGGVAEHAGRVFWSHARAVQMDTPGQDPREFGRRLTTFYRRHLIIYLAVLAILTLAANAAFQAALDGGLLGRLLQLQDPDPLATVFRISLVAFFILGWGLFNCVLSVSLARPELALRAAILGIIVTLAVGLPASLGFSFEYAPAAFMAGTLAFGAAASWTTVHLFQSADYYYFTSF